MTTRQKTAGVLGIGTAIGALVTAVLLATNATSVASCPASSEALLSTFINGGSQSYSAKYPTESAKVFAYLNGGTRPNPSSMTHMGKHLVYTEDDCRTINPPPTTTTTTTTTTPPPPPSGYPDASNTGVPAGTSLSAYSGPSNVTAANTVIDSKTIGCIQVSAPGVVIKNSKISCAGNAVYIDDRTSTSTLLTIQDSEIDCKNAPGSAGVSEADFTVTRVEITGCENGFDSNQNILIEDSFIHSLYNGDATHDAHLDGFQFGCGHWDTNFSGSSCAAGYAPGGLNVTIRHNTIYGMGPGDTTFGTSAIISNRAPNNDTNILIQNNLLAGGAYTLYCDQDGAKGVNYRVIDNHFSTRFKSTVGFYGPSTECSDETQSGNVYHETGAPLNLP